jgi:hypothetical protein
MLTVCGSTIRFEDNHLEHNRRGFMAYASEHLLPVNSKITNTTQCSSLWCERCATE